MLFRQKIFTLYGVLLFATPVFSAPAFAKKITEKYEGYLDITSNKYINKSLDCSVRLIEKQFGGDVSPMDGFFFLDQIIDQINDDNFDLKSIKDNCELVLQKYKSDANSGTIKSTYLSPEFELLYLNKVKEQYKNREGFVEIAKKGINSFAECKTNFALNMSVGLGLAMGMAFDSYSCQTPLGRKFQIFAPFLSGGLGLGSSLELSDFRKTENYSFLLPMYFNLKSHSDISSALIFLAGKGYTWSFSSKDKDNIKYPKLGIGLSSYIMKRKAYILKKRQESNFSELVRILELSY